MQKPERKVNLSSAPWTMHEFFAGSGLVAYGLKGMFSPIWANDISEKKAAVYRANFPSQHFLLEDIKNIHGEQLPFAHLSWASFPCQDLSLAGTLGGIGAQRSGLVWEWLRILKEMPERPSLLTIENVVGLLSSHSGENYIQLHHALNELGYVCGAIVVDASLFVPQSRQRVFVIAVKNDIMIPSYLVDDGPNWLHNKNAETLGNSLPNWIWWKMTKPKARTVQLHDILEPNTPFDKDNVLSLVPPHHQKILDSNESIIATGYRRMRNGQQLLELRFDGIAGCLRTPEGGSSRQYLVVKENGETHARLLTAREVARLMGAPERYVLPEAYNDGYKAMGDAVALPVAKYIGKELLSKIAEAIYSERLEYTS